jgi:hypothetical protein
LIPHIAPSILRDPDRSTLNDDDDNDDDDDDNDDNDDYDDTDDDYLRKPFSLNYYNLGELSP